VTDLFTGPVLQKPVLAIGVPVRRDGKTRYSLNAGVDPRTLSALLREQRLPEGWITAIFDTQGTIVARTHEAERLVGQKGSPELVRRMQEAREDAIESRTLEGIAVLTVFSRSAASAGPWRSASPRASSPPTCGIRWRACSLPPSSR
jgi:hypothetical protein